MTDDPTVRTLRLLSTLQSGGPWPATVLARRLDVSVRTVRRDIGRLRELGYDVHSPPGPGSGYVLRPGLRIPPLLLDDDEVAVVAAGLLVLRSRLPDDEITTGALKKLGQVLPNRLRRRVEATVLSTEVLERFDPPIAAAAIGIVADAVAAGHDIRFRYAKSDGRSSERLVEPYRHVLRQGRSYLVGFDVDRDGWRVFRMDRMSGLESVTATRRRNEFPDGSIEHWLTTDFGRLPASPGPG